MINLLPKNEKKSIDHEYHLRRTALILMAAITIVVVVIVLMVPMYLISIYKKRSISADTASAVAKDARDQQNYTMQINEAKTFLKVLKPEEKAVVPSSVIALLTSHKTSDIRITSLSYSQTAPGESLVNVLGVAQTREALSAFTEALAQEKKVKKVDVPVSNFTKDANIQYTFTMTTD